MRQQIKIKPATCRLFSCFYKNIGDNIVLGDIMNNNELDKQKQAAIEFAVTAWGKQRRSD
ncbi:hypothetical protein LA345_23295 [Burkholderia vietnamiensis]|nr:hypothetical protein [Burkholderia vietnamiensis]